MEEGLLSCSGEEIIRREEKRDGGEDAVVGWETVGREVKRLGFIAAPMVAVTLAQFLLQVVSTMMVGHLGELALSSTSIAISLSGVTGFSFLMGMASALETLCGQAYGAQQYRKLSVKTYTAIFSLILYSSASAKTRASVSREVFQGIGEFFHFAIPSAVMICLEWWSFELLILLSGLLPNPELETSVLSVCLSTISTLYTIPFGVGAATSTRISNELGAGNPQAARVAVYAAMLVTVLETSIISTTLFASRSIFGYTYSNEKEVVDYVTSMAPLVCLSVILDSLQGVLSGVARGCGWQHIGAYVNLGAYYIFGIPIAAGLGFWLQLRGKGLWIGIQAGAALQTVMLAIITSCTNWEKQATNARERIFEERSSAGN
ncbi:protein DETOXIFICATION 12-like isoform X2 [Malania oleifera]|uniref:protein DETOXIFICATION 12-like isoform X2 n=1 Tax=Malania oleifera TaxID=397392 RepID=UPI0025ADB1A6|nr:protein DETOXIFICATION 12-like isoform X2 [Malania oleifera]